MSSACIPFDEILSALSAGIHFLALTCVHDSPWYSSRYYCRLTAYVRAVYYIYVVASIYFIRTRRNISKRSWYRLIELAWDMYMPVTQCHRWFRLWLVSCSAPGRYILYIYIYIYIYMKCTFIVNSTVRDIYSRQFKSEYNNLYSNKKLMITISETGCGCIDILFVNVNEKCQPCMTVSTFLNSWTAALETIACMHSCNSPLVIFSWLVYDNSNIVGNLTHWGRVTHICVIATFQHCFR